MSDTELTGEALPALPAPNTYAEAVLDFLTEEGFRPKLDEDGDVYFKYEGGTYVVLTGRDDPTVLLIVYPYFWSLDDAAERARALEAAMYAQQHVLIGRVTVLEGNVSASVNAYLPDENSFRAVLIKSVDGLKYLVTKFREHMHAQLEN